MTEGSDYETIDEERFDTAPEVDGWERRFDSLVQDLRHAINRGGGNLISRVRKVMDRHESGAAGHRVSAVDLSEPEPENGDGEEEGEEGTSQEETSDREAP
jgi:hypothetical protein